MSVDIKECKSMIINTDEKYAFVNSDIAYFADAISKMSDDDILTVEKILKEED